MLPLCFVSSKTQRDRRQFIRHRVTLAKIRTEVRNRVHALLDKHELKCPYKTLFSGSGVNWLMGLKLGTREKSWKNLGKTVPSRLWGSGLIL